MLDSTKISGERGASVYLTNSGARSVCLQHGDCVCGLARIFQPEKREIVLGGSDLVDFGVRKQRGDNRRRGLAVVTGRTRDRQEPVRIDWRLAMLRCDDYERRIEQAIARQVRNHFADGDINELDLLQQRIAGRSDRVLIPAGWSALLD